MKTNFHNPTIGTNNLRQSVWAKGWLLALVLLGLLALATPQGATAGPHLADGDRPKIGTGG
ncbi:hypothetical protein J3L12_08485 [Meiothermus sp. CFH 77666]|nr:hypothetical protein [Meiothermus sp. CFH 77666]